MKGPGKKRLVEWLLGSKTNGYLTITTPPPLGLGKTQVDTLLTRQASSSASLTVDEATPAVATAPAGEITNFTSTFPLNCGARASRAS